MRKDTNIHGHRLGFQLHESIYRALSVLFVIVMIFPSGAAWAQDGDGKSSSSEQFEDMSLEDLLNVEIDVSSTRAETVFNTPSTVSVIDRTTISLYGFRHISEAIETLAGVSVMRTYLKRNLPTIRGLVQDHYANKVLVLIDGVPAWLAVTGEGSLDRISIDDVERIEVLKGPASVLYGTNAYSGAINLVLRKPENHKSEGHAGRVHGRIGDHKHFAGGGSYTYLGEGLSLLVTASAMDERGKSYNFTDELDTWGLIEEYLRGAAFTMRARYETDWGNHTLLFNAFQLEESYYGVTPRWASGAGNGHQINGYLGSYAYDVNIAELVDLKLSGMFDWGHRDLSRSADDAIRAKITGWRAGGSLGALITPLDWLHFELGGNFDHRQSVEYANYAALTRAVLAENEMADRSVYEFSLFGQAKLMLEPLVSSVPITLLAGVRWTNNELFESNLSARGTLVYRVFEGSSIKVVAGQSFRAPTLFELYFQTGSGTVFGNPDLDPEKSTSVELAYLLGVGKFFAQATGYYATYENKIFRVGGQPRPDGEPGLTSIYENGDNFWAAGAELELRYQDPNLFDAFINYNYVYGDNGDEVFTPDEVTGELVGNDHYNFKYIPEHTVSIGLAKRYRGLSASTVVNVIGTRGGATDELDAQFTWDLNLGYKGDHFSHRLSVKNILDEDVQVPAYVRRNLQSYPTGYGRTFYYTLSANF